MILFEFYYFIYKNKTLMMREISKKKRTISIDKKLDNKMEEIINNKSKYIEWLIYQDLLNKNIDDVENIIL